MLKITTAAKLPVKKKKDKTLRIQMKMKWKLSVHTYRDRLRPQIKTPTFAPDQDSESPEHTPTVDIRLLGDLKISVTDELASIV